MNERVRISIKLYEKCFVPHRRGETKLGKHCFLPSFANVFKCNVIHWLRDDLLNDNSYTHTYGIDLNVQIMHK